MVHSWGLRGFRRGWRCRVGMRSIRWVGSGIIGGIEARRIEGGRGGTEIFVRRGFRTICTCVLACLVCAACVSQVWVIYLGLPHVQIEAGPTNVLLFVTTGRVPMESPHILPANAGSWREEYRLFWPMVWNRPSIDTVTRVYVHMPWLFLVSTWGLLSATVWRLSRKNASSEAFPVSKQQVDTKQARM